MNNGRDCIHGRLARSCEICDLTAQLAAAEKVCEAAERFERKTKISFRMDGYRYTSVDILPVRDAITEWRKTKEGA